MCKQEVLGQKAAGVVLLSKMRGERSVVFYWNIYHHHSYDDWKSLNKTWTISTENATSDW